MSPARRSRLIARLACWLPAVGVLCAAPGALAAVVTVNAAGFSFTPPSVTVARGDTVTWQWGSGTHTVTSGASSAPADDPGALFDAPLDSAHPSFSFRFDQAGTVPYFCRFHEGLGMKGTVTVLGDTVTVRVDDFQFTPAQVAAQVGDVVTWVWVGGFHTVTSGASSAPGDNPGALFDEASDDGHPVFSHTFDQPGDYPYFCRFHEAMGMKGAVLVQTDAAGVPGPEAPARLAVVLRSVPNPFRSAVSVRFTLPSERAVTVSIFDASGREIRKFDVGTLPAGVHAATWDGRTLSGAAAPAGIYLVRVHAGSETAAGKVLKLR